MDGLNPNQEAFFVNYQRTRMSGSAMFTRVNLLAEKAQINKTVGVHTLRHSIATHLLQSGLTLEEVSRFLGHSSLESTQIYTHLAHA
jgi:integrase/recombinase XerD